MRAPQVVLVCLLLGVVVLVRAQSASAPMTAATPQPQCPAGLASGTLNAFRTGLAYGVPDQAQASSHQSCEGLVKHLCC